MTHFAEGANNVALSDVARHHGRGVPNRARWEFQERVPHRYRITIEQGVSIECVNPCDVPVIEDFPDEDRVVVCECARPIEEPDYELFLRVTATLRFESHHVGTHEGPYCDCGWSFIAENIEEVKDA